MTEELGTARFCVASQRVNRTSSPLPLASMEKASSLLFSGIHLDRKRFAGDIARFKATIFSSSTLFSSPVELNLVAFR